MGDSYVWIPVAKESGKFPARAFLPVYGLEHEYVYGFKARPSVATYLKALIDVQKAYQDREVEVFDVQEGKIREKQKKAKWRHGELSNGPLLGPTKGWVKVKYSDINTIVQDELAAAINDSGSYYSELDSARISPELCYTSEHLIMRTRELKQITKHKKPLGQSSPQTLMSQVKTYVRDAAVVAYVLNKANGICECCDSKAPFVKKNGEAFLEVHHVKRLVEGGSDTITNAVGVCPNCHREFHFGTNYKQLVKNLYLNVSRLVSE
jgi:5-methylcytosine-specific restriction protein A